ncbi:hypothetical protein EDD63_10540 [Breznakia blatticola]|uniref:Uncharacterized protein n=1 Tax=Breznakia blatticola TaxID=1754012 RepID=A0A4R8A6V2_9FIRM|nr:hypothetical protein EDD63_10540 [Breznakia blatticola]
MRNTKEIINTAISNTHFVLSKNKDTRNISKYMKYLFFFYFIASAILYIYQSIMRINGLYQSELYYSIYRIMLISFYIVIPCLYYYLVKRNKMNLSDKNFLYSFMIIPILLSFNSLVFILIYYFDSIIMYYMHLMIPLEVIIMIAAFLLIYNFTKRKAFLIPIIFLLIYFACVVYVRITMETAVELTDYFLFIVKMNDCFVWFEGFNIIPIISLLYCWLLLRSAKDVD